MRLAPAAIALGLLLSLAACGGGGASFVCLARHPVGGYADSCEPVSARGSEATRFRALRTGAACAAAVEGATVVATRRACFDLVWNSRTPRSLCMARMDDCEAQRAQLIAEPATYARFAATLLAADGADAPAACAHADEPPTGEPFAGACGWR